MRNKLAVIIEHMRIDEKIEIQFPCPSGVAKEKLTNCSQGILLRDKIEIGKEEIT